MFSIGSSALGCLVAIGLSCGLFDAGVQAQGLGDFAYWPVGDTVDVLLLPIDYTPSEGLYDNGNVGSFAESFSLFVSLDSYGNTSVSTTTAPVIQLPHPSSYYRNLGAVGGGSGIGGMARTRIREATVARAKQMGIDLDAFDREFILSSPQAWEGRSAHGSGNYRTLWISGLSFPTGALWAHEFGHSSGWVGHANFWEVEPGETHPFSPNGSVVQYGDEFDTMGDASGFHPFNPWNKLRAGWLEPGDVLEVDQSDTYSFQSLEAPPISRGGTLPSALRIRIDPQTDYWVFHRATEPEASGGLLITRADRRNTTATLLLDMMPSTPAWQDAELLPGASYTDPDPTNGFQLDFLGFVAEKPTVQVTFASGPQQPAIDNLPTIDVTEPARGLTLRSAVYASKAFEATAFDSDVGAYDGAGIASVTFEVGYYMGESLTTLQSGTDSQAPYGFCLDMSALTTRIHTLRVTATSDGSTGTAGAIQTAEFDFLVDARPGTGGPLLIDCYVPY